MSQRASVDKVAGSSAQLGEAGAGVWGVCELGEEFCGNCVVCHGVDTEVRLSVNVCKKKKVGGFDGDMRVG